MMCDMFYVNCILQHSQKSQHGGVTDALRPLVLDHLQPSVGFLLRWRHNGHDDVSNHQPLHCILNADQRKHQSSASLAFVRAIHRGPVNSLHKWPVTRKMFPFDDVIMFCYWRVRLFAVITPFRCETHCSANTIMTVDILTLFARFCLMNVMQYALCVNVICLYDIFYTRGVNRMVAVGLPSGHLKQSWHRSGFCDNRKILFL